MVSLHIMLRKTGQNCLVGTAYLVTLMFECERVRHQWWGDVLLANFRLLDKLVWTLVQYSDFDIQSASCLLQIKYVWLIMQICNMWSVNITIILISKPPGSRPILAQDTVKSKDMNTVSFTELISWIKTGLWSETC